VATSTKKAAPPAAETAAKKPASGKAPAVAKTAAKGATAKTATEAGEPVKTTAPAAKATPSTPKPSPAKPSTRKSPVKEAPAPVADVISEAALVKMSDKDYMNEAQLAFFKAKLLAMREEILSNARETGEHLKENEVFADPNDRATVEEENMLEQRVRDRERKLMKKINQALQRIESGEYGYCLETGEPIGIPRLLARPTAELSIEAQEKHERREKLYAD